MSAAVIALAVLIGHACLVVGLFAAFVACLVFAAFALLFLLFAVRVLWENYIEPRLRRAFR